MMYEQKTEWVDILGDLESLLPSSRANLRRLSALINSKTAPRLAVFGKYNHGKSTLLNALIGKEVFKVADKRETVVVSELIHEDVVWIDTPGLDADVKGDDDKLAMDAALEQADILCLVHNVKAGELDSSELKLYKHLMRQDSNYRSKLLLVLTQIDQVTPADLDQVVSAVQSQLPDLTMISVSAHRYVRGIKESKKGFIEASGIGALIKYLDTLKTEVAIFRQKEAIRLIRKAKVELNELIEDRIKALASAQSDLSHYVHDFITDIERAHIKINNCAAKLELL